MSKNFLCFFIIFFLLYNGKQTEMGGARKCLAPGCRSSYGHYIYFRALPKNPDFRIRWLASIPKGTRVPQSGLVCELHFKPCDFERVRQDGKRKLKPDAVPSIWPQQILDNVTVGVTPNNASSIDYNYVSHQKKILGNITNTDQRQFGNPDHSYVCYKKSLPEPRSLPTRDGVLARTLSAQACSTTPPDLASHQTETTLPASQSLPTLEGADALPFPAQASSNTPDLSAALHPTETSLPASQPLPTLQGADALPLPAQASSNTPDLSPVLHPTETSLPGSRSLPTTDGADAPPLPAQAASTSPPQLFTASYETKTNFANYSHDELMLMVQKQREEICRLQEEDRLKTKQLSLLNRALQNHMSIKRRYNCVRSSYERLQARHRKCPQDIRSKFSRLRDDQIAALGRKSTRGLKWSPESIRDGLVLKMRCGTTGYAAFVQKVPVLPAVRTLQSHVQFVSFESGYFDEMFDLIGVSAKDFNLFEQQCGITLDEMAIKEGERFDPSTKRWVGKCTLPTHSGLAKKALVFMVAGLTRRWKQAVAFFYTNKKDSKCTENDTGKALADILNTVITKSENAGLQVNTVTCDMGPDNQAWWRHLGIDASRNGPVKTSFSNPVREAAKVFVLPDPPHLLKTIKRTIEVNRVIRIPQALVQSEDLPTDLVEYRHIKELCEHESDFELKIAFRLKESNVHCDQHFSKMNVSNSRAVLCHRTGVALKKMAEERNDPSFLTTAWFVLLLNVFFQLVTSRHRSVALSKSDPSVYEKAINIIKKVDFLFQHMRIGDQGTWKPCQRGVRILCASILGLQDYCFNTLKVLFLLLGHLTQDCLENLFSCIRMGQPTPHALAFKQHLKAITLAMFHSFVKGSSYDHDHAEYLVDPLSKARQEARERAILKAQKSVLEKASNPLPELTEEDFSVIAQWERRVIYDMVGSVLHSLQSNRKTVCSDCTAVLLWTEDQPHPYSTVTQMKEFCDLKSTSKEDKFSQLQVSHDCFLALFTAEVTFRKVRGRSTEYRHIDVLEYLVNGLSYVWDGVEIPPCHDIGRKLLTGYLSMRMK